MESREVESCVLAGMLISCLGWWDFYHRGGGLHAIMGVFGLSIAVSACTLEFLDRRKKKP